MGKSCFLWSVYPYKAAKSLLSVAVVKVVSAFFAYFQKKFILGLKFYADRSIRDESPCSQGESEMDVKNESVKKPGSEKKAKKELLLLLLLLVPVGIGALALTDGMFGTDVKLTADKSLSESLLSKSSSTLAPQGSNDGLPVRQIPETHQVLGSVDDRYTLAIEPKTGELLINDSMGSIGTNNTSVEGLRAELAQDMLNLEQYAEQNKDKLTKDAYNWLKKVAKTGMALAFGAPGLPAHMQPEIKLKLLAELHHISANPSESIMHTNKFLELEKTFGRLDEAYYNNKEYLAGGKLAGTGYFEIDPLYSPSSTLTYTSKGTLQGTLSTNTLSPSLTAMASPTSPYNYVTNLANQGTAINTTTTTVAATPTSSTTTTTNNTISGPTLTSYYDAVLGTEFTKETTTTSPSNTITLAGSPTTNTTTTSTTTSSPIISGTATFDLSGGDASSTTLGGGTSTATGGSVSLSDTTIAESTQTETQTQAQGGSGGGGFQTQGQTQFQGGGGW